jgi:molecular chaperone GrpE (heat shock protein)
MPNPINTPRRLADAVENLVNNSVSTFAEGITATENQMFKTLKQALRDLTVDKNGNIKRTAANRATLRKIKRSLKQDVLTNAYEGRVSRFLGAYDMLGGANNEYFKALSEAFLPNEALFNEIKRSAIELTTNSLTGAGIEINVIDPVAKILDQNITTGGNVFELEEQLRQQITSTEEGLGALSRYTGQITRDSLNQFSANYHESISADLGLNWFQYAPGKVKNTRPFCANLQGKYFHRSEIPKLIKEPWAGMIPGTNSSNFLIYRGGFNCMHPVSAVSEAVVPDADKARVAAMA